MQEKPVVIESNFTIEETSVAISSANDIPEDDVPEIDTSVIDELIDSARSQATTIIDEAKKTAELCLNEAEQKSIEVRQQAYDEGYQQGYQKGIMQGRQDGLAQMQQTISQTVAKTQQILAAGEQEAKQMIVDAERQIVDIALAVARKILAYEIRENPMVVLPLVKAALQKVSDQEEVVIRVSMDDFDAVLMAKKDLQTMVGREHALKIIVDNTIECGSCVIDTSYGAVDARVDTQFENIKKALQGVA